MGGFVTIQNNILLKLAAGVAVIASSFVTIQNNILLKHFLTLVCRLLSFVTIQNNILLKQRRSFTTLFTVLLPFKITYS